MQKCLTSLVFSPDHRNLFIENKLDHFILQKMYNAASKPPAVLQMHTRCFWPECRQCNNSGGGASVQIQPTPKIPITLPQYNPSWGIRGVSVGIQPAPRTPNPGLQYFAGWGQSTLTGYHPYQFQDPRWCDPRWWDPNFWEYQPRISNNDSWQLWYQGQSTPIQQQ